MPRHAVRGTAPPRSASELSFAHGPYRTGAVMICRLQNLREKNRSRSASDALSPGATQGREPVRLLIVAVEYSWSPRAHLSRRALSFSIRSWRPDRGFVRRRVDAALGHVDQLSRLPHREAAGLQICSWCAHWQNTSGCAVRIASMIEPDHLLRMSLEVNSMIGTYRILPAFRSFHYCAIAAHHRLRRAAKPTYHTPRSGS